MELVMKLKTSLPVIATGVISLAVAGQASAGARSCVDIAEHAEKLTLQAERYQKRAAELKPGEHEKYIRALKKRANKMRGKAMSLLHSCEAPHHHHHYHHHH